MSAVAAFVLCALAADAGVLVPLPKVPGSVITYAEAINNHNQISGFYTTQDGEHHGFVGTMDGNYTTFDALNGQTIVRGLNDDGYITGFSQVQTEDCPYDGCEFLRRPDGTIVTIDKDHKPLDGYSGQIVDRQKSVGEYIYPGDDGFYYDSGYRSKQAKYRSDFVLPLHNNYTAPRGLSSDGTVTGWFEDPKFSYYDHGFVARNGAATAFDYPDPNTFITQFEHTNRKEMVAGAWYNLGQTVSGAFIFDSRHARFKPIDVPGATLPFASSVNDAGIVTVGDGDGSPYIYCPHKKTCPLQAGAIEVPEHWIAAPPVAIHASSRNDATHRVPAPGRQLLKESGLLLPR
jgi:hypothetical protein